MLNSCPADPSDDQQIPLDDWLYLGHKTAYSLESLSLRTLSHYHSQLQLLDDDLALTQLDHLLTDYLAAEEQRDTSTTDYT